MTYRCLDSIYPANLPAGADAYLGYVGGRWPTLGTLQRLFPDAHLLSTAVSASEDAECLDVESGDATVAQIYGWFTRQRAREVWRPVIYSSVSNIGAVVAAMTANGIPRAAYRLLAAHYTYTAHICGPGSCGATDTDCDGSQWRNNAPGVGGSLVDESLLSAAFFGPPPPAPAPVLPLAATSQEDNVMLLTPGTLTPLAIPPGTSKLLFVTEFGVTPDWQTVKVGIAWHGAKTMQYVVVNPNQVWPAATVPTGVAGCTLSIVEGDHLVSVALIPASAGALPDTAVLQAVAVAPMDA